MSRQNEYPVVRNRPVARFFYKGTHTHPVRRTVVLIKPESGNNSRLLHGYELREGFKVRDYAEAPIKSYTRSEIARLNEIDQRRKAVRDARQQGVDLSQKSTLERANFIDLLKRGY